MKDKVVETASKLADLAPRRGGTERKAAELIKENISEELVVQEYDVVYPEFKNSELHVDGEKIECLPGGFKSGEINSKNLVNSVHNGQGEVSSPAISFNPHADGISVTTFYEAPVVAIAPSDVSEVLEAEEVSGELEVQWRSGKSRNILVGNTDDPSQVVMTHYDSLWGGFIDNGFSVSLLVHLLEEIDLESTLVVFAGSEEVSQESPYHCYGYRRFEAEYSDLLESAESIKVVDSLGRGSQQVIEDPEIVEKAIVFSQNRFIEKTDLLASSYGDVLDIYHSKLDKKEALTHYEEALELLREQLLKD
ncbi:tetratricopeptide repeat protein [Candidatus Nanohalococcus occultus]|uniref:Peptidase family M28/Iap family n=1 Tax=Candidatus Nanohalococcus occultus TaxID=2978047 RepID=A0ABY8CDE8_9ARCH|nr:Peptidase family M28/Iap family [Candidatus Nanohaloarchaeota archaeon SVXNc]